MAESHCSPLVQWQSLFALFRSGPAPAAIVQWQLKKDFRGPVKTDQCLPGTWIEMHPFAVQMGLGEAAGRRRVLESCLNDLPCRMKRRRHSCDSDRFDTVSAEEHLARAEGSTKSLYGGV